MISFKEFCRIDEGDVNLQPKSSKELIITIKKLIKKRGNKADLNDIDTSNITEMIRLFNNSKFNGDISKWNVSNVKHMSWMFNNSEFNGDISKWDVSNVKDMIGMFQNSYFNKDLNKWHVKKAADTSNMFKDSQLHFSEKPKWYIA